MKLSKSGIFTLVISAIVVFASAVFGHYFAVNMNIGEKEVIIESPSVSVEEVKHNLLSQIDKENEVNLFRGLLHAVKTIRPELDCTIAEKIVDVIINVCKKKNIDPVLITAIIAVESMFDPFAKSNKGAIGLMQVRYEVWKHDPILIGNGAAKKASLYWLDINIECGTDILKEYMDASEGDIVRTLWRYNSGQTSLPREEYEISYANKVLLYMYKIKQMMGVYRLEPDKRCHTSKFKVEGGSVDEAE